jgi:16S rRNA (guanine966-N2)-methyltransferase
MIALNFESLGWERERLAVRVQDAFQAIAQLAALGRKFDLIFADPPYGEKNVNTRSVSFAQKLLDEETLPALLTPEGSFILGHSRRDQLELPPRWLERKQLKHGDSIMRFLERPAGTAA